MSTHTTPVPSLTRDARNRRRVAALALALLLLAAVLATVRPGVGTDGSPAAVGDSSSRVGASAVSGPDDLGGTDGSVPSAVEEQGGVQDVQVGEVVDESGDPAVGGGDGTPLDDGGVAPVDPCSTLPAGRSLLVSPSPVQLAPTVMASHLVVMNCSNAAVAWTAHTVPKVTLGLEGGALAAGAEVDIPFSVDENAIGAGAFTFKIKVSEPGSNTYVDVHAYKGILNPELPPLPDPVLSAGPGVGGCAQQCIKKAWLTPNATTPNPSLEITTTTPAGLRVWVSTNAPTMNGDVPSFPGVGPIASNAGPVTNWTTVLSPLTAATRYHIIVAATDEHDETAYRVGEFTTTTPVAGPDNLAPNGDLGGCGSQCIAKALLSPIEGSAGTSIAIETTVPAQVDVYTSRQAPQLRPDGTPHFPDAGPIASTGGAYESQWTAELDGLDGDTTYHVIVDAVDGDGRRAFRVGTFRTHLYSPSIMVTFHTVRVLYDGDGPNNPGELAFRFGVNGQKVGSVGEQKLHDGATLHLKGSGGANGLSHTIHGASAFPLVQVQGIEHDPRAVVKFCDLGTEILGTWGRSEACRRTWNTASSGIIFLEGFDSLPSCEILSLPGMLPGDRCMYLETTDHGNDFARFIALVSFRIVD